MKKKRKWQKKVERWNELEREMEQDCEERLTEDIENEK